MSWTYQGKTIKDISDFPPNSFGFVYVITHLESNKKYIGKKVLYFSKKVKLGKKELKRRGLKGREWAIGDEAGFTSEHQANRVMDALNTLFKTWKPREKYEIVNATKYKGKFLNHKIIY